jgi:hypothetical protein
MPPPEGLTGVGPSRVDQWLRSTSLADALSPRGQVVGLVGELAAAAGCIGLVLSLFLPWHELPIALPERDGTLSGWEVFRFADVVLAVLAALGLAAAGAGRLLRLPVLYIPPAAAGWGAVAVTLYAVERPGVLMVGSFPAPPAIGFFVALCAAGAMVLGSQLAFLAGWASAEREG